MSDLIWTGFMVFLMAGLGWVIKAAGTGQIKRNAWFGLRTEALKHCDECWLLGHHAAAQKSTLGCWSAAVVMAVGGVGSVLIPGAEFLHVLTLYMGLALMLTGVLLGLRDANVMVAKMHGGEPVAQV
ncbi:hypothetical protein CQ018_17550 [Arthrobacter sp. MYb227]|uniref:hypothetical protein n=1 Tax=Arthrobacter sp. MYb227 TaxID=1848601 RepID=UPI000CFE2567|nr:hypothetical protein [Arthrobacter sp. MYb227]PQZ87748.1 hypothetical protein CQ018_17550 [Arthrobacter sp. MYb227]